MDELYRALFQIVLTFLVGVTPAVIVWVVSTTRSQSNKHEIEILKQKLTLTSDTNQVQKETLVVNQAVQYTELLKSVLASREREIEYLNKIHQLENKVDISHAESIPILLGLQDDMVITKQQASLVNQQVTDMRLEQAVNAGVFSPEEIAKTHAAHQEKDLAASLAPVSVTPSQVQS